MTGLFRRLREAARERLFLPVIQDGQPDSEPVRALAQRLERSVDDTIEEIVNLVSRETVRMTRVEARHRHALERYLVDGYAVAREFLSALPTTRFARENELRAELRKRVASLARSPADELGSQPWLESELSDMLRSPAPGTLMGTGTVAFRPTLLGTARPLSERPWSHADANWAREHHDLPEFHLDAERFTSLEIAAAGLRWWAHGRKPDAAAVVDQLVSRGEFRAARSALNDAAESESGHPACDRLAASAARLREAFSGRAAMVRMRLATLVAEFGAESLSGAQSHIEVEKSLERFDADEALEWCGLLEAEAAEAAEKSRVCANPEQEARRAALVRLLLLAGATGFDEFALIEQLEDRWAAELVRRQGERKHMALLANALAPHASAIPSLSAKIASLEQRSLEAGRWLQDERSSDLTMYLEEAVRKLAIWLGAARAFDVEARAVLERLVIWFLRFIDERTDALRALADGEPTDAVFERILDVRECFANAGDPASCAAALAESGEARENDFAPADRPEPGPEAEPQRSPTTSGTVQPPPVVSTPLDLGSSAAALVSLIAPIGAEDWAALGEAVASVRRQVSTDEDRRRLDEVEEFASTVAVLQGEGNRSVETVALVATARVLGGSGGLVQRALPTKRLLEIALLVLSAAIRADHGQASEPPPTADPDGSWTALLGRKGELLRQLSGPGALARTVRVLENLCTGPLGADVVERLWHAVTNAPEVGALRAGLLAFLNDRSLDHLIVQLSSRYDQGIKERLKQLLELRAVATGRPDLVRVAQTVADQVASGAKTVPFRLFVKSLPSAAQSVQADLVLTIDDRPTLRLGSVRAPEAEVTLTIEPRGLVPEQIEASLFPEDDITFADGSRRRVLAAQPVYVASEYPLPVRFGNSWTGAARREDESIRVRVSARALTGELINRDAACSLRVERVQSRARRIDDDTLLEAYPGVEATPAVGEAFIGRGDELERLHETLVSARQPSPVLLTGMRRIGKTSLLFAFHERHRQPDHPGVVTVYLSLAERRSAFLDPEQEVGSVFFAAIAHALGKRNFSSSDHNRAVGERLHARLGPNRLAPRQAIQECRDPESLADSLVVLGERILGWLGGGHRVVFLVDEAETLVVPYREGGAKRVELEQLLQSLREVSQTARHVGILLSGSNHIVDFAREYKNAFFGSCTRVDLAGLDVFEEAARIVAPPRVTPFITFEEAAIRQAIGVCSGMPQFMWQLGAAAASLVRGGTATKADIRRGVSILVGNDLLDLPFRPYDVLEPLEHMLGLQGRREQDLLWLLLWRVANTSSLVADEAQQHFVIDQTMLELDDNDAWKQRLIALVNLDILNIPRPGAFSFRVPIFAEGFRSPRQAQQFQVRRQRASAL
jgi:hypothetical protein